MRNQPRPLRTRMRNTRQRAVVEKVLQDCRRPLTAQEVLSVARQQLASLGIATVYRTLATLEAEGAVAQVQLPNDPPRFEPHMTREHHYFRCQHCRRAFWVFGSTPEIDRMKPAHCIVDAHSIFLYGCCVDCRPLAHHGALE
ncbi:MAG: transcriptional repressor [Bryobacterales bacterium]|nr:transcriptional repressor [Bryobacterales bacterium]